MYKIGQVLKNDGVSYTKTVIALYEDKIITIDSDDSQITGWTKNYFDDNGWYPIAEVKEIEELEGEPGSYGLMIKTDETRKINELVRAVNELRKGKV